MFRGLYVMQTFVGIAIFLFYVLAVFNPTGPLYAQESTGAASHPDRHMIERFTFQNMRMVLDWGTRSMRKPFDSYAVSKDELTREDIREHLKKDLLNEGLMKDIFGNKFNIKKVAEVKLRYVTAGIQTYVFRLKLRSETNRKENGPAWERDEVAMKWVGRNPGQRFFKRLRYKFDQAAKGGVVARILARSGYVLYQEWIDGQTADELRWAREPIRHLTSEESTQCVEAWLRAWQGISPDFLITEFPLDPNPANIIFSARESKPIIIDLNEKDAPGQAYYPFQSLVTYVWKQDAVKKSPIPKDYRPVLNAFVTVLGRERTIALAEKAVAELQTKVEADAYELDILKQRDIELIGFLTTFLDS